jgi:hypothetical protein
MKIKATRILVLLSLVLGLLALVLTIGDLLALHDIGNDYVSQKILAYLDISLSKELPAWTATSGEWRLVEFSWVLRTGFFLVNAVTLVLCLRALGQRRGPALALESP